MSETIEQDLRRFIVESFLFGQDDELSADESLLEKRIIDSTGILELAAFIHERWGVKVQDEELLPENFGSIANMVAFIERRRAAG